MEINGSIMEWQQIADYWTRQKSAEASHESCLVGILDWLIGILGWILVFFGGICLWLGVERPVSAGMVCLGILLIVGHFWIARLSPNRQLLAGSVMRMIAAIGCFAAATALKPVALIGAALMYQAIREFSRYLRFRHVPLTPPSGVSLQRIEAIIKEVREASLQEDVDTVAFRAKAFHTLEWKGRFFGDVAVFIMDDNDDILIAKREDVEFSAKKKGLFGTALHAAFHIGKRRFIGTIEPHFLERYERWKTAK